MSECVCVSEFVRASERVAGVVSVSKFLFFVLSSNDAFTVL